MTEWSVCMRAAEELLHCRNSPGPLKLSLLRRRINKRRPRASFFFLPSSSLSLFLPPSYLSLAPTASLHTGRAIFCFLCWPLDITFPGRWRKSKKIRNNLRGRLGMLINTRATHGAGVFPLLSTLESGASSPFSLGRLCSWGFCVCPIKADWVAWIDQ